MKRIVFVSGKGGTGKSTVAASLSLLVENKMLADCDVDAPDLDILLKGAHANQEDFYSAAVAEIDPALCTLCGKCAKTCRFGAVNVRFEIDPTNCEGCGACVRACPEGAISMHDVKTGETYVDSTERGTFAHARLSIGEEASGKLVTAVKRRMEATANGEVWALIDGSPGIGCAVIASIAGADAAVAVCEPTVSGLSDLMRVLDTAAHFGIPAFACINKYDLNMEMTSRIEELCRGRGVPVLARLPFDPDVMKALQGHMTPVEAGLSAFTNEIRAMWEKLAAELDRRQSERR
jgi:MinD superfamily P-loop ATPase